jgi:hypothetical protein
MFPTAFLGFCPHSCWQFVFPQKRVSSDAGCEQKLTLCPCRGAGACVSTSISDVLPITVLPQTQVLLPLQLAPLLWKLRMP